MTITPEQAAQIDRANAFEIGFAKAAHDAGLTEQQYQAVRAIGVQLLQKQAADSVEAENRAQAAQADPAGDAAFRAAMAGANKPAKTPPPGFRLPKATIYDNLLAAVGGSPSAAVAGTRGNGFDLGGAPESDDANRFNALARGVEHWAKLPASAGVTDPDLAKLRAATLSNSFPAGPAR